MPRLYPLFVYRLATSFATFLEPLEKEHITSMVLILIDLTE